MELQTAAVFFPFHKNGPVFWGVHQDSKIISNPKWLFIAGCEGIFFWEKSDKGILSLQNHHGK